MKTEGKYRPNNGGEILYNRDANGRPLPAGQGGRWVNVKDCDMGHIIDAVAWWNTNGRLTGPRRRKCSSSWTILTTTNSSQASRTGCGGQESAREYLPPI